MTIMETFGSAIYEAWVRPRKMFVEICETHGHCSPGAYARAAGLAYNAAMVRLSRFVRDGVAKRKDRGVYVPTEAAWRAFGSAE